LTWPIDTSSADFEKTISYHAASLVPNWEPELFKRSGNWPTGLEVTHSYVGDRRAKRLRPACEASTSHAAGSGSGVKPNWVNDDWAHWEEYQRVSDTAFSYYRDSHEPHATEANELLRELGSWQNVSQPPPPAEAAVDDMPLESLPANSEFGGDVLSPAIFDPAVLSTYLSPDAFDFLPSTHAANDSRNVTSVMPTTSVLSGSQSAEFSVVGTPFLPSTDRLPSSEASQADLAPDHHVATMSNGASSTQYFPSRSGKHCPLPATIA